MKIKRDQVTGLALVVLGIVFAVLVSQFKKPFTAAYPGPKLVPAIGVFGLIVCGLGIFVNSCRQQKEDAVFVTKEGWVRIIVTFAVLCVYVFAMKYLGFLVVTPFVLFAITSFFSKASNIQTKLWVRIVFALAVTFVIWFMYVRLFSMTLPTGLLFE